MPKFSMPIFRNGRNNSQTACICLYHRLSSSPNAGVSGCLYCRKLNFNEHVHRICSKASAQISALQRLTGLVEYQSRKAIYTSFIASNFNYCPLAWFFTSRESINKMKRFRREHSDLFSRITLLVITIFYWNPGLIHLEYTLWSLSWLSYSKF